MSDKKLTPKQIKFCEEYLIDLNATQAAIRAGYSEKTAGQIAEQNLRKLEIKDFIQGKQQALQKSTNITQERVLKEYARIAFVDIRSLYDESGNLKAITGLDEDTARAIAGIEVVIEKSGEEKKIVDYIKKIKMIDKKGALDSLAKHLGMFTIKIEHSGGVKIIKDDI